MGSKAPGTFLWSGSIKSWHWECFRFLSDRLSLFSMNEIHQDLKLIEARPICLLLANDFFQMLLIHLVSKPVQSWLSSVPVVTMATCLPLKQTGSSIAPQILRTSCLVSNTEMSSCISIYIVGHEPSSTL